MTDPQRYPTAAAEHPWGSSFDIRPRQAWVMIARNRDVFLKTWKVNLVPPMVEPVLYLLALGYGLGALITDVDGMPYVRFIAPALITITMMQSAFFETTYSSFVRMHWQKTWDAAHATPLTMDDILLGELLWAGFRSVVYSCIMAIVVGAFGLLTFPSALLLPVLAFFVGMTFAALGLIATATVPTIDSFSYVFYLFITPQFLFAGTFFPLHQLPDTIEHAALLLPLTPSVLIVRAATHGAWDPLIPYAIAYLLVTPILLGAVAIRLGKRRVVS